jgi:hypothetical protein
MNNKFDELTKSMAQSVTRRQALRKFGVGIAGILLVAFGLPSSARADKVKTCATAADCGSGQVCCSGLCYKATPDWCQPGSCCCYCTGPAHRRYGVTALTPCDPSYNLCSQTCINYGFFDCGTF